MTTVADALVLAKLPNPETHFHNLLKIIHVLECELKMKNSRSGAVQKKAKALPKPKTKNQATNTEAIECDFCLHKMAHSSLLKVCQTCAEYEILRLRGSQ